MQLNWQELKEQITTLHDSIKSKIPDIESYITDDQFQTLETEQIRFETLTKLLHIPVDPYSYWLAVENGDQDTIAQVETWLYSLQATRNITIFWETINPNSRPVLSLKISD